MSIALWDVRLSDAAVADYDQILAWTLERFGPAQARAYADRIAMMLEALKEGPTILGVRHREEIVPGLFFLRLGRRTRHIIVFGIAGSPGVTINVLRILHDAMDIIRHL